MTRYTYVSFDGRIVVDANSDVAAKKSLVEIAKTLFSDCEINDWILISHREVLHDIQHN